MDNMFTELKFDEYGLPTSQGAARLRTGRSSRAAPSSSVSADEFEHVSFMGSAPGALLAPMGPGFEHHSQEFADPFSKSLQLGVPALQQSRAGVQFPKNLMMGDGRVMSRDFELDRANLDGGDDTQLTVGPPTQRHQGMAAVPPEGAESPPPLAGYVEPLTSYLVSGESMWSILLSVVAALSQAGAEVDPVEGWSVRARALGVSRSAPFLVNVFHPFPNSQKTEDRQNHPSDRKKSCLACVEFQRLSGDSNAFLRLLSNTLAKLDTVLMAQLRGAHPQAVESASSRLCPANKVPRPRVIDGTDMFGSSSPGIAFPVEAPPPVLTIPSELSSMLALPDLVRSREAAEAIASLTCHWIAAFYAMSSSMSPQGTRSASQRQQLRVSDELIDHLANALRSADFDTRRAALVALSNLAMSGEDEREQVARNFAAVNGMVELLAASTSSCSIRRETLRGLAALSASAEVAAGPIARFVRPYCAAQDEDSRKHANAFLRNVAPRLVC